MLFKYFLVHYSGILWILEFFPISKYLQEFFVDEDIQNEFLKFLGFMRTNFDDSRLLFLFTLN